MGRCFPGPVRFGFPLMQLQFVTTIVFLTYGSSIRHRRLVLLARSFGAYNASILVCFIGKRVLDDFRCSRKPDSVSGHTFYHAFLVSLWLDRHFNPGRQPTPFPRCLPAAALPLHATNLAGTFFGAYHTPRQIYYSGALGIVACWSGPIPARRRPLCAYGLATVAGLLCHGPWLGCTWTYSCGG